MESPFLYGTTVSENTFTNRVADIARLNNNLQHHVNTILISPRRWGKSSLVKKVSAGLQSRNTRVIMLDLLSIRNEQEFYKLLAAETIKASSNKLAMLTDSMIEVVLPKDCWLLIMSRIYWMLLANNKIFSRATVTLYFFEQK